MDAADQLIASFTNMHLPSTQPTTTTSTSATFTPFPTLPTELRQKIYTHTLPRPTLLPLTANIHISDLSFGLYLTFSIPKEEPRYSFSSTPPSEERIKEKRMLPLLVVSKESRDVYLEEYSVILPSAVTMEGRIYISLRETLYVKNIAEVLSSKPLRRAMENGYRLQDWVGQVRNLAVPVKAFVSVGTGRRDGESMETRELGRLARFLVKCRGLRSVSAVMWEGFWEEVDGDERRRKAVVEGMRAFVGAVEEELGWYKMEVEGGYEVPAFQLI